MNPRYLIVVVAALVATLLASCSQNEDPAGPDGGLVEQPHRYSRDDLTPEGVVAETANGYTVQGTLRMKNEGGSETSFVNADLDVEFDENGLLKNVSGSVEVPPPSPNVSFSDPIQADVGFFRGKFLNEQRDLPILLKDDIDYFVFRIALKVEMKIRDEESGSESEITVRAPIGGEILMVADYNDPMHFTYGQQDILGAGGSGQSFKGRIPYVPIRPHEDILRFDGKTVRVGTVTLWKVFSITGVIIEGSRVGLHLVSDTQELDPVIEGGYYYGVNGEAELSLPVKDVVEFTMPLAEASAALRAEASTQEGLDGAAFINGLVDPDVEWWPGFIPFKPIGTVLAEGILYHTGTFDFGLSGAFGFEHAGESSTLNGSFRLNNEALTLEGSLNEDDISYRIRGVITLDETTVTVTPPDALLERVSGAVNTELDESIAEAEKAWNDFQEATKDYEYEFSLRGLKSELPGIIDYAKGEFAKQLKAQIDKHKGEPYYSSLKSWADAEDDKYYNAMNNLKSLAQATTDSDAWRKAIESALRTLAGYKYFEETYKYKIGGITIKTVNVKVRILSDSQVDALNTAADNVKYIKETWEIKVKMQQIYDAIPDKEIFERVKDEIEDGVVMIPTMAEFGYTQPHDGSGDIDIFAVIDEQTYPVGNANVFDVVDMAAAVAEVMVRILIEE